MMEDSKRLTGTRYIMDDETPCQFCDIETQNCCPYKELTDEAKERRCRIYLYFMVLKAHEAEKFGKADEAKVIRWGQVSSVSLRVYDISLVAQHMIEENCDMSKNKVKALHNGEGFTGKILDEETYELVKAGEADWKPNVKAKMTHMIVPVEVFYRLMELDKAIGGKYTDTDV